MSSEAGASKEADARKRRLALARSRLGGSPQGRPIERAADRREFPLSTAQQRLWLLEQAAPGSLAYQVPAVAHLRGPLDVLALERSVQVLVGRHEILRARFKLGAHGVPVSEVLPARAFKVDRLRVDVTAGNPRSAALAAVNTYVRTPFDLEHAPLMRVLVLELGGDDHLVAFVFHHIICDAWSLAILFDELERLYAQQVTGRAAELHPVAVQFGDFARWERANIESDVVRRDLQYWAEHLRAVPTLELPTDRPRPRIQTQNGAIVGVSLSESRASAVEEFARASRTTPFVVTLAVLYVLLHRYTAQPTVTIGTPVSNRDRNELQGAVGFFVSTLVFRADLSPEDSFAGLVERVRETVLEGFSRQAAPFERIVDELRVERDPSRNPIFQVMFAFQNSPMPVLKLRDVGSVRMLGLDEVHSAASRVDLSIVIEPQPSGSWSLWAEYNTDLFDRDRIERLLSHYQTLLEELLKTPSQRIAGVPMMSASERQRMMDVWRGPKGDIPQASVVDMFREMARRHPANIALRSAVAKVTYGDLDRRSDELAARLIKRGASRGTVVTVLLPRSVELVLAELAVLKTGAAYAPIDPAYPPDRVAFMIGDTASKVTLTTRELSRACPSRDLLCLDEDSQVAGSGAKVTLAAALPLSDHDLAYVIYTSGSTGKPKGVEVEHRGLKNLIAWHQRTYGITSRDVSTLVASPGFDASVWEIWPYLSSGAAIAIPEEDVRITPDRLVEWLAANDVTLSFLPTPLAEAVLNHTWPGDTRFRALLTGGDVLHPVRQTNLSFRIYNHYGPTEGAVVATFGEVSAGENAMPSIGRPIDNTEAYILDMNQQPVPIGVPGELYIAGAGVARGYRNQPQLTGERFVANPLRNSPWKRAYRTGDSCRFLGDGRIQFEGRQDTQIKIRGFRVELGEIESLIAQEPGVGECAVALRTTSESRQAALVAYFVATTRQSAPTPPQLRRALSAKLPQYMIPQIFVLLDALPKSASGKIDRSALPKAEMPSGGNEESREVRTRAEQLMAEAWKEVLGVKTLGSEDNFFDLGGNSLLAVQVVRRVQRVSGASINPLILLSGTLAQAAEALEQTLERSTRGPAYGWRRWMSALMQNIGRPKR